MRCSGNGRPVCPFDILGTVPALEHDILEDWLIGFLRCKKSNTILELKIKLHSGDSDDSNSFRPCYKARTSPSSKLGDYIDTMHLAMHVKCQKF